MLTLVQGQLKPTPITIGLTDGSTTEIVSGLKAGDVVVTAQTSGTVSSASTASKATTTTTSPLSTGGGPGGRGG